MSLSPVHVIGGGLAGAEAAWQIAQHGVPVVLYEMRPHKGTEAHKTDALAELVCSNSLRSDDADTNAVGLLHAELRDLSSLIMAMADAHKVPAGGALAVDREGFAKAVTAALENHPLVTLERREITALPPAAEGPEGWDQVIVASGPLTAGALAEAIQRLTGADTLSFFDAVAPIVYKDSVDLSRAWFQSRYDKEGPGGTGSDYINCGFFEREAYEAFVAELLKAEKIDFKEWEKDTGYFNGCLPVEVMAERGAETLRFGPMKPVGLTCKHTGRRPYAVVQLRQDNALGTLYNLVGFQTKMKHSEQTRVFRLIPGLENAVFARLGGMHRNTFLNSPRLLDHRLRLKAQPNLRFAGQITGVEGYVESAAMGLLTGLFAAADRLCQDIPPPPRTTSIGALWAHITGEAVAETFQPMNANFGLFPPLDEPPARKGKGGINRKQAQSARARQAMATWQADWVQN